MCGIAGIVSKKKDPIQPILNSMIKSLNHRGPDSSGSYVTKNIGLAHTRLSIIDLDDSSNQPMHDLNNRYSIIFNGEILNYLDLKEELLDLGANFRTSGDTEVLLIGYIKFGFDFLKKIRGFYAFCIYDKIKHELVFARDLFGKKPLYFYNDDNSFIFGSEIKSILSVLNTKPEMDYHTLSHYLWKGYYANGDSAFKKIKSMLPGQIIKVSCDSLKIEKISIDYSIKLKVSENYKSRQIDDVRNSIVKSIEYRMVADVPISFLLSGGVDSSLISYLAAEKLSKKIDTHYVGFNQEDQDVFEDLAMDVSKKIESNHHVLNMQAPNIDESIKLIIKLFDEPFGDYSALPSFDLYKEISKKTKVAISGDGADEIFCGYKDAKFHLLKSYLNAFAFQGKSDWLLCKIYKLVNSRKKTYRNCGFMLAILFLDSQKYSLSTCRGGWNLYHRKEFMKKDAFDLIGGNSVEKSEESCFEKSGDNIIERYMNYDLKRLSYDFLVKVDRTSMANSLEVRSPFLDVRMVNSLNFVKTSNMVDLFKTKKELKSILQAGNLNEVTQIPKQGFTPPLGKWLSTESGNSSIQKILADKDSIINRIFERKKIENLTSSKLLIQQNQSRIWYLIVLDAWFRKNYFQN